VVAVGLSFAALLVATLRVNRWVVPWRALLVGLLLVILFVPIRRYQLPAALPFHLELYRLFIVVLFALWLVALLIDPRVRLRRTGLEAPLFACLLAVLVSIAANGGRIGAQRLDTPVVKFFSFFLSFLVLVYVLVSLVRSERLVTTFLKVMVGSTAVLAVLAVVEARSGFNLFNHLHRVLPFLKQDPFFVEPPREGRLRAYGPAEHPIALSALFAMMVPIAGYFAWKSRRAIWWVVMAVILVGCVSTLSRTGALMLVVEAVVLLVLRPRQVARFWPAILPLLLAVHFALPGRLGTLGQAFFPSGGLTQEQQGYGGTGRLGKARLAPTFSQLESHPLFGIGYGTRITGAGGNSLTLDDEWLDTALETGIVGVFAWMWLIVRFVRRIGAEARRDLSERGWLLSALVASVTAFGVSMVLYDAFSFVQVTFVFYMLLALGVVLTGAPSVARQPSWSRARPRFTLASSGVGLIGVALAVLLYNLFLGESIPMVIVVLLVLAGALWLLETVGPGRQRETAPLGPAP
jgi:hypothetical protein